MSGQHLNQQRVWAILLPLYLVIFFGYLGLSITTPLFTFLFLTPDQSFFAGGDSLAQRTTLLGVTLALYPLGQFIGSPIIGRLSDHLGRRPMLIATLGSTVLFYSGVAFGLAESIPLLVGASLFLAGLCEGNVALAQSAIADFIDGRHRMVAFGWINGLNNLSSIIGPIAGGLMASSHVVSWFRPSTPYWSIAFLLLIMTVWIVLSFPETAPRNVSQKLHLFDALTNLRKIFTHRRLRPYYLFAIMINISMCGYFRAYPIYGKMEYDLSLIMVSLLVAYISVPCLIGNTFLVRKLATRFALVPMTAISAVLMGISLFVVLIPEPLGAFWFTLLPPTIFATVSLTSSLMLLSSVASPEEQGQVLGNNQAIQEGANAFAALMTGVWAGLFIWLPFVVFGVIAIGSGWFFYRRLTTLPIV